MKRIVCGDVWSSRICSRSAVSAHYGVGEARSRFKDMHDISGEEPPCRTAGPGNYAECWASPLSISSSNFGLGTIDLPGHSVIVWDTE